MEFIKSKLCIKYLIIEVKYSVSVKNTLKILFSAATEKTMV